MAERVLSKQILLQKCLLDLGACVLNAGWASGWICGTALRSALCRLVQGWNNLEISSSLLQSGRAGLFLDPTCAALRCAALCVRGTALLMGGLFSHASHGVGRAAP